MSQGLQLPRLVKFEEYELDFVREELRKHGFVVKLQPQPFKILAYLASRPGELVTRQEIRDHVWPGDTFVDFDLAINQSIKQIRAALNDDPETPRIIATVPRRGYRFVSTAVVVAPNRDPQQVADARPANQQPESPARTIRARRRLASPLIALACAGMLALLVFLLRRNAPIITQPHSLTVLPLASRGSEAHQQLGLALADAIITKLGHTGQVQVRSTAAVRNYVSPERDVLQIARNLNTEAVLDGHLDRQGNQVRVRLQLISARDGTTLWSTEIEQAARPMFELEEQLASQITEGLHLHLTAVEQAALMRRYTGNPEAYAAYLAGRAELLRYTREGTLAAVDHFQQALRLDPDYTLARIGLATAAAEMYLRFASESELRYWSSEAEQENRRAVELEPNLAETHQSLAAVYRQKDFNWDAVLSESRRALELNPALSQPHYYIAAAYYHRGLLEEATEEVKRAFKLAPESRADMLRAQGVIALYSGRYQDSIAALEQVQNLASKPVSDPHLGMAYFYAGERSKAIALLQGLLHSGSASAEARASANLAAISAATRDITTARQMLGELDKRAYRDHHVTYSLAAAYAGLGESRAAVLNLRRAADTGLPCYPWLQRDPLLNPVRSDPDFQRVMRDLKAQWQQAEQAAHQPSLERF